MRWPRRLNSPGNRKSPWLSRPGRRPPPCCAGRTMTFKPRTSRSTLIRSTCFCLVGPLVIEHGVGDQAGRLSDFMAGLEHMRECLGSRRRKGKIAKVAGATRTRGKELFVAQVYFPIEVRVRSSEVSSQRCQQRVQARALPQSRRKNCACPIAAAQSNGRAARVPGDD